MKTLNKESKQEMLGIKDTVREIKYALERLISSLLMIRKTIRELEDM